MSTRTHTPVTTFEREAKTLELPWRFTGREDELELIRRSLTAGHHGIVVTGPVGCGKTRLVAEAVRGSDRARAAGTPETRHIPFAAFAHLLPEAVSLHRAVQLLSGVRLLVVDDAHLLDDASAALVHQLAVHGRTRLVVVAADGGPHPGAISRLWTGELLPRLALEPLPREDMEQLLAAGVGGSLEPLTLNRLHQLCQGDLRLLHDLVDAVREHGLLTRLPETDAWAWRGPVPVTATVRERTVQVLEGPGPEERRTLERLAFGEPLPLHLDDFEPRDLDHLENLEAGGLIHIDDSGMIRLRHPLHGPVLRAAAGRLRASRLARTPDQCAAALAAESAALTGRIEQADVRALPTPVGEWLAQEGAPVPVRYASVRARFARLRGELREAVAWAREGLRDAPGNASCRAELALAAAQSGDPTTAQEAVGDCPGLDEPSAWLVASRGDVDGALAAIGEATDGMEQRYGGGGDRMAGIGAIDGDRGVEIGDAVGGGTAGYGVTVGPAAGIAVSGGDRTAGTGATGGDRGGATGRARGRGAAGAGTAACGGGAADTRVDGGRWAGRVRSDAAGAAELACAEAAFALYDLVRLGAPEKAVERLPADGVFARHADALARGDGPALDRAAEELEGRGFLLFAAEAHAQAVHAHRDPSAARTSRTRAVALARRCQGARTPALSGLVLGELTARQRQIVTLAAAGLSNRQIAEKLTLSIRTVGNHLYSAYARLGASDRSALPWLVELPDAQPA
ncbi:LuxR C-terminal-related transcriptional regulator [Streptomyces sp. NBC_00078]|uniref:LuxR C-terminal-related transcriptional regulator n=1 Tax=unclassified Streptomyces TaxID=2593676 RepID=UPI00224E2833|nr:LuxR C-terminal-related transcriptional regulator [Streptomyces sp. NBC_00078]MCX5425280.1 LuxR C-terminal-related transcriptional regulator [Streptomyces sp. NBC_00078]